MNREGKERDKGSNVGREGNKGTGGQGKGQGKGQRMGQRKGHGKGQ